jgi:hypothetical protein
MGDAIADWRPFDYADKDSTAPKLGQPVWVHESFYEGGVTIGYFDGFTMRLWHGSDDCSVTHWAPMNYPHEPEEVPRG